MKKPKKPSRDALLVSAILGMRQNLLTMVDKRDLFDLVRWAYWAEEISIGRAAELLGLPIEVAQRALDTTRPRRTP